VLVHEQQLVLGIGTMVLQDNPHMQSQIDYGAQESLGGLYRMLKRMGVTHAYWEPGRSSGWFGFAGDFVFFDFVRERATRVHNFGGSYLAPITDGPDLDLREAKVAYLGCPGGYHQALYSLASMNFPDVMKITEQGVPIVEGFPRPELELSDDVDRDDLIREARYVAYDPGCNPAKPEALEDFTQVGNRSSIQLWVRTALRLTE
jgi:hypothetical protein